MASLTPSAITFELAKPIPSAAIIEYVPWPDGVLVSVEFSARTNVSGFTPSCSSLASTPWNPVKSGSNS